MEEGIRKEKPSEIEVNLVDYIHNRPCLKVSGEQNTSAHEIASKVIKEAVAPYLELESRGVFKNLRIIFYGGAVSKLKSPKDYDLLVLYDGIATPEDDAQLSQKVTFVTRKIFDREGKQNKSTAYSIDVKSDTPNTSIPKYVDIQVKSSDVFLDELKQSPEQIKKRAFGVLFGLPSEVTSFRRFYDGFLYSAEEEEEDRRPAITFVLTLAKAFDYTLSPSELSYLGGYFEKTSALHKIINPKSLSESNEDKEKAEKRIDQYLLEMSHYINVDRDTVKSFLEGKFSDKQSRRFITEIVNNFITTLGTDAQNKIRWAYIGLLNNTNPEMGIADSGVLIKGDNYIVEGQPLFKEDKDFLKFK